MSSPEGMMNTMEYYGLCFNSYKTYANNKETLTIFQKYAMTPMLCAAYQSASLLKSSTV